MNEVLLLVFAGSQVAVKIIIKNLKENFSSVEYEDS